MSLEWAGGGGQRNRDRCISAKKEHVSLVCVWWGRGGGWTWLPCVKNTTH